MIDIECPDGWARGKGLAVGISGLQWAILVTAAFWESPSWAINVFLWLSALILWRSRLRNLAQPLWLAHAGSILTVAVVVSRLAITMTYLSNTRHPRPEAVGPLLVVSLMVATWLYTLYRRSRARSTILSVEQAEEALDALQVRLGNVDNLTIDECDAVLSRFADMGLLTFGMSGGEYTIQETPVGNLFRDLFA